MISRFLGLLASFAVGIVLITLAVANRHGVVMALDPFNPQRPVVSVELPFYAYLFAMLILGVAIGGLATWMSQGKWRRTSRLRTQEALRWKAEAERLTRERDQRVAETKKQLAIAGR